jgi:cysteinyl-tRNA synthetase
MKRIPVVALTLAALAVPAAAQTSDARADLSEVQSWAIQLQKSDIDELEASEYDLLVIDYSPDGTDPEAHTAAEIDRLRRAGKVVLAYLPLGELSDFRFYWQKDWTLSNPSFVGPRNLDWPGAYRAVYWDPGFLEQVIWPPLDRILAAGFDGLWLDTSDSYWFWHTEGHDLTFCADAMAALLHEVSENARSRTGEEFVICANNGLTLLEHASAGWRDQYLADIDGVTAESIYYNYWTLEDQANSVAMLEQYAAAGKKLLSLEYIGPESYQEYLATIAGQPFEILPYAAEPDQELDELIRSGMGPIGDDGGRLRCRRRLSFGRVVVGEESTRVLRIRNRGEFSLTVQVFEPTTSPFSLIDGAVMIEIPAGAEYEVELRFRPEERGRAKGAIELRSTDPRKRTRTVRLRGRGK